jgi:hypothetical protein
MVLAGISTRYLLHHTDRATGREPDEVTRAASLEVDFDFDRLSDDKSVAFFKVEPPIDPNWRETIVHELQRSTNARQFQSTLHIVRVRNHLNDTPIPSVRIDYNKMELSCDWRALFTHLYAEEVLCSNLLLNNSKLDVAKDQMRDQIAAGQLDAGKAIEEALKLFGDLMDDNRKMARRARIWRLYEQNPDPENPDFHWEAGQSNMQTEKRIMEELKVAMFGASFDVDSDDESDGEEEGDGEGSEEEEDEWEDEEDEVDGDRE